MCVVTKVFAMTGSCGGLRLEQAVKADSLGVFSEHAAPVKHISL